MTIVEQELLAQQAAMRELSEAQKHLFAARGHLIEIHPVAQESIAFKELLRLEEKLNDVMAEINKLRLTRT